MLIVADQNIPGLAQTFGRVGSLEQRDGRSIQANDVRDAQVLLVRSVTRVDEALLEGSKVRFVATTTIGTDHLDTDYLDRRNIAWAYAPGCNANAAAQYTAGMILLACQRSGRKLHASRVGILGHGNVGSRLARLLRNLGAGEVLACDPPLSNAGHTGLVDLHDIQSCDIISIHVPLVLSGPYPTMSLVDRKFLRNTPRGSLLVNSARGQVVDQNALIDWMTANEGVAALDVWPREPQIDPALLDAVAVATPHVAGYSLEGKWNGSLMAWQAFTRWRQQTQAERVGGRDESNIAESGLGLPAAELLDWNGQGGVTAAVICATRVFEDDREMRRVLARPGPAARTAGGDTPADRFDHLRNHYPLRRDFSGLRLPPGIAADVRASLLQLGFQPN